MAEAGEELCFDPAAFDDPAFHELDFLRAAQAGGASLSRLRDDLQAQLTSLQSEVRRAR